MTAPVFYASESELAVANDAARATFKYFWRELSWERRRIVPAFANAVVKIAFEDRGKIEHMWVADVDFDGESLRGSLLNQPNELQNVRQGDAITARFPDRLGDWMLIGDGVLGA